MPLDVYLNVAVSGLLTGLVYGLMALGLSVIFGVVRVVNFALNELAFNPKGPEEGFLFWASWVNHAGASIFSTQDAHGPIRRGLVVASCQSLELLENAVQGNPALKTLSLWYAKQAERFTPFRLSLNGG